LKLKLTQEDADKIWEDQYLDIIIPGGLKIYVEVSPEFNFEYGEIYEHEPQDQKIHKHKNYYFDRSDLNKLIPTKPRDWSYYRNDPLCPNCGTYMVYNFEYCPKCGQALDWRGRE